VALIVSRSQTGLEDEFMTYLRVSVLVERLYGRPGVVQRYQLRGKGYRKRIYVVESTAYYRSK
jgi:hypothetical protein